MHVQLALGTAFFATSVASAMLALMIVSHGNPKLRTRAHSDLMAHPGDRTILLFDGGKMIGATPKARRILDDGRSGGSDWDRFGRRAAELFPNFAVEIAGLGRRGRVDLRTGNGPPMSLVAETFGRIIRVELFEGAQASPDQADDARTRMADAAEIDGLREIASLVPVMTWREDMDGHVIWANRAYFDAVARSRGVAFGDLAWPLPNLFGGTERAGEGMVARVGLQVKSPAATLWFDHRWLGTDRGTLHFAAPADQTVRAETQLHGFVQTLTKTFADLPVGLAVFDRKRQLALFNPALDDLTMLGTEFLSARPTLFAFLDRLRELRMIPEPKDYPSWRERMADLEKQAASGIYEETWTLPAGQTYHVIGRPHPDGAVAFLLEDISAETSLTRRYRSDIDLRQKTLDAFDEAVAIFSPEGLLVVSNAAYAQLWGHDPRSILGEMSIDDALRQWSGLSRTASIWKHVLDFVKDLGGQPPKDQLIELINGHFIVCRFRRLAGGVSLIGFSRPAGEDADPPGARRRIRINLPAVTALS